MIVRYVRAMQNTLGSNVETMYTFIKGKVEATEFMIGAWAPIAEIPLSKLRPKLKENVLVAAILRDGDVIIPHGQDTIKPGDAVVIVSKILGLNDISDIIR
jgi:trk system potassium uptake protein TrkA